MKRSIFFENVLNNFIDELPTFLKVGMSVQLGELGTLRLNLSGQGVDTIDDFNASTITTKVIFTPSVAFKDGLKGIKFEHE
ncbi:MAG: hypothetical protein LBB85_11440 [Dysgonamonadaceae bacterium]|jgi:nucleoid DNA-binding protein|nr:hypothetical protein [Dysgonamonadaceae bacterium]